VVQGEVSVTIYSDVCLRYIVREILFEYSDVCLRYRVGEFFCVQ